MGHNCGDAMRGGAEVGMTGGEDADPRLSGRRESENGCKCVGMIGCQTWGRGQKAEA
jgi:hypothetical protein